MVKLCFGICACLRVRDARRQLLQHLQPLRLQRLGFLLSPKVFFLIPGSTFRPGLRDDAVKGRALSMAQLARNYHTVFEIKHSPLIDHSRRMQDNAVEIKCSEISCRLDSRPAFAALSLGGTQPVLCS